MTIADGDGWMGASPTETEWSVKSNHSAVGGSAMEERRSGFDEEIGYFLNACPGPAVVKLGLHIVAFQPVRGIQGLEPSGHDDQRRAAAEYGHRRRHDGGKRGYLHRIAEIAERVGCRRADLSEAALRHGFQFSKAVRWIRFLHGMALHAEGVAALTLAIRLGFSDLAGWNRFTKRLVGRTPSQLPTLSLRHWVRRGVDGVFLSPVATGTDIRATTR